MLTVAAIDYTIDQNEPSHPFLLELNCSEDPTKFELEVACREAYFQHIKVIADEFEANNGESYGDIEVDFEWYDTYGDVRLSEKDKDSDIWFLGLPERLREKFKLTGR